MRFPNKSEIQQISINHSTDVSFNDLKCTANSYSFVVNDTTLESDKRLHFRRNLLERYKNQS